MREEASAWRNRNYNLLIMVLKVPSLRLCIPKLLMPSVSKTSYALEIVAPIFFNSRLFADPAWDMLLVLYAMELEQRRISVGGLCASSRVPATTALSWIRALTREGLIQKHSDPLDGRRVHVRLSPPGSEAMGAYFARIANYSQGL
jgi:hypothetical protein